MMLGFRPLEFVVTAETTYILIGSEDHYRRIFTGGRDWPAEIEPAYAGYSIGKWIHEDGDGRYDVLEVETRAFSLLQIFGRKLDSVFVSDPGGWRHPSHKGPNRAWA